MFKELVETIGAPNNATKFLNRFDLFVGQQLRVTHNVDQEDVRDLEFQIGLGRRQ